MIIRRITGNHWESLGITVLAGTGLADVAYPSRTQIPLELGMELPDREFDAMAEVDKSFPSGRSVTWLGRTSCHLEPTDCAALSFCPPELTRSQPPELKRFPKDSLNQYSRSEPPGLLVIISHY